MEVALIIRNKDAALTAGGTIFGLVGLLHLLRLFTHSDMVLGGHKVPVRASGLLCGLAWLMAGWLLAARSSD